MDRPPLPPFTLETAAHVAAVLAECKARIAQLEAEVERLTSSNSAD